MSDKNRPRRFLLVLAALLLPAATCGIAPALRDLTRRVERLERFAANAQLPLVLMDEHDLVVGTVLEYNDMFKYASVNSFARAWTGEDTLAYERAESVPWAEYEDDALATIQVSLPGKPPVMLEANRKGLLTPKNMEILSFESTDCTGTPLAPARTFFAPTTFFSRGWIGAPGKTLYVLSPDTPAREAVVRSVLLAVGDTGKTQVCETEFALFAELFGWDPLPWTVHVRPFEPVADLSLYTPPFRIVDQRTLFGF